MSDLLEIGFDDAGIISVSKYDKFKQTRHGEKSIISIVSFRRHHDTALRAKTMEKGSPLTDEEKANILSQVDKKLAERLSKKASDLSEADRLDIKNPKFVVSNTHFDEKVGTIRCLSKYEGKNVVKPEICCQKFGEAEQAVGVVIMQYPVGNDGMVDGDLLSAKKYTNFFLWKLSAKKFKDVESVYKMARLDKRFVIDLMVELDGDPKYQKQKISCAHECFFLREDFSPDARNWILEQGLKATKSLDGILGFEMKREKILEKLGIVSASTQSMAEEIPQMKSGYDSLVD
jgi:hypothetical protein